MYEYSIWVHLGSDVLAFLQDLAKSVHRSQQALLAVPL
jgi:hypothetical protein